MSLRVGNPTNYSSSNIDGGMDAARAPMNEGISWIAQSQLANYASRFNRIYENALKVDANKLMFWIRGKQGTLCTCSRPAEKPVFQPAAPILKPNQPAPFRENKVRVVRISDDATDRLPPGVDPIWQKLLSNTQGSFGNTRRLVGEQAANDLMGEELDDQEYNDAFPDFSSQGIYGGDKHACGICFSTGYTQGYSMFNGKRIILDTSGELPFTLNGAIQVPDTYPRAINTAINGSVVWKVELPTWTNGWLQLSIRNNMQPAVGCVLEYSSTWPATTWAPLTLDALSSTDGTQRIWSIRVRKNPNASFNDQGVFTHAEIFVLLGNQVYGTAPNIETAIDYNAQQPIVRVNFSVNGSIPEITRESVFTDSKYNALWKVLDIQQLMTSANQVLGYSLSTRLVQRHEMLYGMITVLYPNIALPYQGLAPVQGGGDGINQLENAGGQFQIPPFNTQNDVIDT